MVHIVKNKTLLQEMREILRRQGYAYSTEKSYCDWVTRFIQFHQLQEKSGLLDLAESKVEIFLTDLAIKKNVAPATQNQALNALVFLYTKVLKQPLEGVSTSRSRKEPRVPVVLTKEEVKQILLMIDGMAGLIVRLLYASGLRISEAVRLRVQDVDFGYHQITVRDGKGKKDRVTPLAISLIKPLENRLLKTELIHQQDIKNGLGSVYLPYALAKKYPHADKEFRWQYVFASRNIAIDPRTKIQRRHHVDPSVINKTIKRAVRQCGIHKKVSAHTFRHSFATHLLQSGSDIRTIQSLLGHADLQTTMIYTHVLHQGGQGVKSPLDDL